MIEKWKDGIRWDGMWIVERERGVKEDRPAIRGKKKALCGNRGPSNDCLPYEKR
jgi:hypothetical protein